jgi:hypothetical protein
MLPVGSLPLLDRPGVSKDWSVGGGCSEACGSAGLGGGGRTAPHARYGGEALSRVVLHVGPPQNWG